MKDRFEKFATTLTDKTLKGKVPWEELEQGNFKLQFKKHYINLSFDITLLRKPEYPIKMDVFTNEGKLIMKLIQTPSERYYNRIHALCRAVRGEYHTIDDTIDLLEKDMPF